MKVKGLEKMTRNLNLPLTSKSDSFVLPGTILPKTDFVADLNIGTSKNIVVNKGDSILFPLRVEPNSILTVEHWAGDSLLYTEKFNITDSLFNYKTVPAPGDNRIVFKLTDRFNNTTTTEVFITKEREQAPVIRPEYSSIIAQKQVDAFISMLRNRADGDLKRLLSDINVNKHKFGTVDDVVAFIKEEGIRKGIDSEEVDKLALEVAAKDNVLSQAAVDYIERFAEGRLKELLTGLDIYEAKLKTWTDLQEYLLAQSGGAITPESLNALVADILAGRDPAIQLLRDKVLAYAKHSEDSTLLREAVTTLGKSNIRLRGEWLHAFGDEALKRNISYNKLADLLAAISSIPGSDATEFLSNLIIIADEPLLSALKSLDLNKEKIRTPGELILFLLTNPDKIKYPEDLIYKALAEIIASRNLSEDQIAQQSQQAGKKTSWWLLIVIGGALILILVLWSGRKSKQDKSRQ